MTSMKKLVWLLVLTSVFTGIVLAQNAKHALTLDDMAQFKGIPDTIALKGLAYHRGGCAKTSEVAREGKVRHGDY